jgi:hypothetical protein
MEMRIWNRAGYPSLWRGNGLPESRGTSRWGDRRPTTAEEIRIYAWLYERLALLHRERRSWRAKVRRFLGF